LLLIHHQQNDGEKRSYAKQVEYYTGYKHHQNERRLFTVSARDQQQSSEYDVVPHFFE
jgi:hypothetical protein